MNGGHIMNVGRRMRTGKVLVREAVKAWRAQKQQKAANRSPFEIMPGVPGMRIHRITS